MPNKFAEIGKKTIKSIREGVLSKIELCCPKYRNEEDISKSTYFLSYLPIKNCPLGPKLEQDRLFYERDDPK